MHTNITEIFCFIDDSAKLYEQNEKSLYCRQIVNHTVKSV